MRKIFILIGIIYAGILNAQEYYFEHISSIQGLSNNIVRDIIQSSDGYMWFATSGGLNRFNGRNFDIYRPVPGDIHSLSYSRLYHIFEDKHGYIWVISSIGNIHRVNPLTHEVDNFLESNIIPAGAYVRSFMQTCSGNIWLVTDRGLLYVEYPDAASDKFRTKWIDNSNGLSNLNVNFIYEDKDGQIWIGTDSGLQWQYQFNAERDDLVFTQSFSKDKIAFTAVLELDGKLYFGTGSGKLIVFEQETQSFEEQKEMSRRLRGSVTTISAGNSGSVLIGTTIGDLLYFEPSSNKIKYFEYNHTASLDSGYVIQIFPDSYGKFWLVNENRGVYKYDPEANRFSYFDLNARNRSFLGESDKQVLFEDSNKDLWIGINGGGLFLYERDKDAFRSFMNDPDNSTSISSNIILSLYEDHSKNLWIGTSDGGVDKLSLHRDYLRKIKPVENPQNSFENYIRAIATDALGNIWVGSKAGKIYVYKNDKKVVTLPDDLQNPNVLPVINVYCLFFDYDNNLWIGTKGEGIYVLRNLLSNLNNLKTRKLEVVHFSHDPANRNTLSSNNVYSITQDYHGQYWIASFQGGLDLLVDPFANPEFTNYNAGSHNKMAISSDETRYLFLDNKHNLWIATSNGVSILEKKNLNAANKEFINLTSSIGNQSDLSGKVVYQICQAQNNEIVLALLDGGFDVLETFDFDAKNFVWKHYNEAMNSPTVYSVESDFLGNVWLGAENGLRKLNTETDHIERYNFTDNKSRFNFTESASLKTSRNELVFGTSDGFILFNPELISKDTAQYPLKFSGLEINGEKIDGFNTSGTLLTGPSNLKLNHDQDNITLYFATLDYSDQESIQYSCFLEGYDTYWSNPSTQNSVTYRKLPPGDYVLRVKSTNSSGFWMENESELPIEITPPFWKSTLGYGILTALFLLISSTIIIVGRRQVVMRNENRIEKALNERRIQYYTNISNDFKTPLSLILNPAEEILQSHKSSSLAKDNALIIKKNATYLKRLIEQILEFRKIREGKMQLLVNEINLIEFFREVYLMFLPLAKRMEVTFDYKFNIDAFIGFADIRILEKIVYNLLSNAFRYTPTGRNIQLVVEINNKQNLLSMKVQDDGPGINENDLPKIFDRFYERSSSSGIGLFFTRELVLLHKGEIRAQNNPKRGATFEVSIPVTAESYENTEIAQIRAPQTAFDLNAITDIEMLLANRRKTTDTALQHNQDYFNKVLLVSSDDNLRTYLSLELARDFNVVEANSGSLGVELANERQPDLILCDVNTSDINGFELTKLIKQNFNTSYIPVILLSNIESEETWIDSAECGADELIIKPFNLKYLIIKVSTTIVKWKKLKERFERDLVAEEIKEVPIHVDKQMIDKVQTVIDQNLANPDLNVEFIANTIGISRTLFYKRMKKQSGFAPNQYLNLVRMKEAAHLLSTTNKSVSEISNSVGFADSNYFCKTFKKHYGKTPTTYKQIKTGKGII